MSAKKDSWIWYLELPLTMSRCGNGFEEDRTPLLIPRFLSPPYKMRWCCRVEEPMFGTQERVNEWWGLSPQGKFHCFSVHKLQKHVLKGRQHSSSIGSCRHIWQTFFHFNFIKVAEKWKVEKLKKNLQRKTQDVMLKNKTPSSLINQKKMLVEILNSQV